MRAAPIRHDQPVKTPFLAEGVGQKPFILATVCSVYLVIGGHYAFWLAFFYDYLEWFQIYFANRSFIAHRITHETIIFTVVEREMFDAGSNTLALDSLNFVTGKRTG